MSVILESLDIGYRNRSVATELSAVAQTGRLTALIGPNGAGKSTLLRTLCGLQPPLAGQVSLEDGTIVHDLKPGALARRIAVVLTQRPDPGMLQAVEVVELGRTPHLGRLGKPSQHDRDRVAWALDAVNADELAHRSFSQLSDGERQRILVARALAQDPELLVLDEPTAHLDAPSRVEFLDMLRQLARNENLAVLLSSHDLELVMRVADEVWLLERRGRFTVGSPARLAHGGAISAAFDRGRLRFNPYTFAFEMTAEQHEDDAQELAASVAGRGVRRDQARREWVLHDQCFR